jgi:hypothetical protein
MKFPKRPISRGKSVVSPETGIQGPPVSLPKGRSVGPVKNQPQKKRRKTYSPAQLFEINEAKYWETKWQTMEDQMYMALSTNRKKAWDKIILQHTNIRTHLAHWPQIMTSEQIKERVMELVNQPDDPLPSTMLKRLTRLNYVAYDQHTRLWLNICSLLPDSTSLPDSTDNG